MTSARSEGISQAHRTRITTPLSLAGYCTEVPGPSVVCKKNDKIPCVNNPSLVRNVKDEAAGKCEDQTQLAGKNFAPVESADDEFVSDDIWFQHLTVCDQ